MRKDLTKMLFMGLSTDKDAFFSKAQSLGLIEFIGTSKSLAAHHQAVITSLMAALKILRGLMPLEQLMPKEKQHALTIAENIVITKETIEKLTEKKRIVKAEIERIKPFGSFHLPHIKGLHFQFFVSRVSLRHELQGEEGLFLISSDENFDYWFFCCLCCQNFRRCAGACFRKKLAGPAKLSA